MCRLVHYLAMIMREHSALEGGRDVRQTPGARGRRQTYFPIPLGPSVTHAVFRWVLSISVLQYRQIRITLLSLCLSPFLSLSPKLPHLLLKPATMFCTQTTQLSCAATWAASEPKRRLSFFVGGKTMNLAKCLALCTSSWCLCPINRKSGLKSVSALEIPASVHMTSTPSLEGGKKMAGGGSHHKLSPLLPLAMVSLLRSEGEEEEE